MYINHKKSTGAAKGFTLTEMLVVIAILAILGTISFPLVRGVIDKGKAQETKARMAEFESAISSYNNDTGQLPHAAGSYPSQEEVSQADLVSLVEILLNREEGSDAVNDKGKKYLLMPDAKKSKNGILYADDSASKIGKFVSREKTTLAMVDAWGHQYEVLMDYDLDGQIDKKVPGQVGNSINNKLVILISKGADGDLGTSDDIYSWK